MGNLFAKLLFKFFKTKTNDIITYKLFKNITFTTQLAN